ncbi:MAG TPA: hypothetical protein VMW10_01195 [Alphaproteobacteria bacterium]|nr:hypothetical protein [Alphaproteobacteria bacterium]
MQNLIAFFIFQITSLGIFALFSPLFKIECDKDKIGTSIFWGFWGAMLLTYLLALVMPTHLNLACYLIFLVSLFGIGRLVREKIILDIFKSHYVYCLVFLLPFVFFLVHKPSTCDEYGHWVLLPKIYIATNELITGAITSGMGYTPLWTLQAAFFEFFIPGSFSESVLAVIKMGIFVSFLFFLKETLKLKTLAFLVFAFLTLLLTAKFNKHLVIEFPIYILITSLTFLVYALEKGEEKKLLYFIFMGTLSIYMVKKSMIAILPSVIWYLWAKNYKKELFAFIFVFCFFVISWKMKTYGKSELLAPGHTINSFTSSDALLFYSKLVEKVKENFIYFIAFAGSLYLMFRESWRLFVFYAMFSSIFITALLVSYLFSFHVYEALKFASFVRYLTSVFYPAYLMALYILVSKPSEKIEIQGEKLGRNGILFGFALLSLIIGGFYVYQGYNESKRDYVGHLVSGINPAHLSETGGVLILGPASTSYEYWRFKYHFYPCAQKMEFYPIEKLSYKNLQDFLSQYNLIIVRQTNEQLNQLLKNHWEINPMEATQFYLYKKNNKVEFQKL